MDEAEVIDQPQIDMEAQKAQIANAFFDRPLPEPKVETQVSSTIEDVTFQQPEAATTQDTVAFNEAEWIKQNFGVESIDELKAKLDTPKIEYRDLEFEDEETKNIVGLLKEKKYNDVGKVLYERSQFEGIMDKSAEEKIKAHIKYRYPDFDKKEIEAEYKDNYTINEDEYDEEKLERQSKKMSQKIREDAAIAEDFFKKRLGDLKFPERQVAQPAANPNDAATAEAFNKAMQGVETRVKPFQFSFKDEQNKLDIPIELSLEQEKTTDAKTKAQDILGYYEARYVQSGQWDADKMLKDVYTLDNFQNLVDASISQGINKYRADELLKRKNVTVSGNTIDVQPDNRIEDLRKLLF